MAVRLPANGSALKPGDQFDGQVHLVCYSDASHAPLRVTKRCEFLLVETNIYLHTQRAQQNFREALF